MATLDDAGDLALRCRLSDGATTTVEFSASSPRTLAAGCARALARYCALPAVPAAGRRWCARCRGIVEELRQARARGGVVVRFPDHCIHALPEATLKLQIRHCAGAPLGWFAPQRGLAAVHVWVNASILDRRPPDDWTAIWDWCQAERQASRALRALAWQTATAATERP